MCILYIYMGYILNTKNHPQCCLLFHKCNRHFERRYHTSLWIESFLQQKMEITISSGIIIVENIEACSDCNVQMHYHT